MEITFKGKHDFIKSNTNIPHPDWVRYMVALSGGYESFELEEDFNAYLEAYREKHKDDYKNFSENMPEEETTYIRSLPECRKIGFTN